MIISDDICLVGRCFTVGRLTIKYDSIIRVFQQEFYLSIGCLFARLPVRSFACANGLSPTWFQHFVIGCCRVCVVLVYCSLLLAKSLA